MRKGLRVALAVAGLVLFLLAFASPALAQGPVPPQERKPQPERFLAVDQIPQPDVLELGSTIVNLAPGATQRMGARINVAPGVREYLAQVDWDNTLNEAPLHQINNSKKLVLAIPKSPVRP
jgi:hypothetical protein